MLLPLAAAVAGRGWKGYITRWCSLRRPWIYCPAVPVLLVCALRIPTKLVLWVPHVKGFQPQFASFAARASAAYLLLVGALLMLDFLSARACRTEPLRAAEGGIQSGSATAPSARVSGPPPVGPDPAS